MNSSSGTQWACVCATIAALALAGGTPAVAQCESLAPVDNTSLTGVITAIGLTGNPLLVTSPPGDSQRLFLVEQTGAIRLLLRGSSPAGHTLFLDLSGIVNSIGNERGLLGLAFDPDYATNGHFYVNYSELGTGATVVSRFTRDAADPDLGDPNSELRLMSFSQPQSNHNGGHLAFGPDGMLYISTGDGGGANDLHGLCGNSQNTGNLLGKILRIDPRGVATESPDCSSGPYRVPADNPLADGAGGDCDEIWSYGLRNPWRFAFDAANGDLYIGDVGQNCVEEINYVDATSTGGENYGWRQMEGDHCFNTMDAFDCVAPDAQSCSGSPPCNDPSLTMPILPYARSGGNCSVTGGLVYRGAQMPNFQGKYFYGDYCAGSVLSFEVAGGSAVNRQNWTAQVDPTGQLAFDLTSFGQDAQGELYVVDRSGTVYRITAPFADIEVSGAGAADTFLLDRDGDWNWEDVQTCSNHPVAYYRVYRGQPGSAFDCIHSTLSTTWSAGGDSTVPSSGNLQAYLVTAVGPLGNESSVGETGRIVQNPCAAP